MLKVLLGDKCPEESPLFVHTQFITQDRGRPDLVLEWPSERWFIESKFWADLTVRQREGYENSIRRPDRLLFLIPEVRQGDLPSKSGTVDYIAWKDVHGRLLEQVQSDVPAQGSRARFWMDELLVAIRQEAQLGQHHRSFSVEEVHAISEGPAATGLSNALFFVDDIARALHNGAGDFKNTGNLGTTHAQGLSYGRWLKRAESWEDGWIWFGFWIEPWRKHWSTPLWIECGPVSRFKSLLEDDGMAAKPHGTDSFLVPVKLVAGRTPAEAVTTAVELVKRVAGACSEGSGGGA